MKPIRDIDEATIKLIKARDSKTWKWVWNDYFAYGFGFLLSRYRSNYTEDQCYTIAKNSICKLFENILKDAYVPMSGKKTSGYFIEIVIRTASNTGRKRGKEEKTKGLLKAIAGADYLIEKEARVLTDIEPINVRTWFTNFMDTTFIDKMEKTCQQIIWMKYVDKIKHLEISAKFGYEGRYSIIKLARCMTYLRKLIKETFEKETGFSIDYFLDRLQHD